MPSADKVAPAFAAALPLPALRHCAALAVTVSYPSRRDVGQQTPHTRRARFAPAPPTTTPRHVPRAEMVHVSVPLLVEAPPDLCFNLFSDLSRMPEWSSTLQSVSRDRKDPSYSTWAFAWRGVKLSWRARDSPLDPDEEGRVIRWAAISGLPHEGEVTFVSAAPSSTTVQTATPVPSPDTASSAAPLSNAVSQQTQTQTPPATTLTLSVDYDVGQLLAALARVPFVSNFVESAIRADLQRFRSYALRAYRAERRRRSSAA